MYHHRPHLSMSISTLRHAHHDRFRDSCRRELLPTEARRRQIVAIVALGTFATWCAGTTSEVAPAHEIRSCTIWTAGVQCLKWSAPGKQIVQKQLQASSGVQKRLHNWAVTTYEVASAHGIRFCIIWTAGALSRFRYVAHTIATSALSLRCGSSTMGGCESAPLPAS